MVLKGLQLFQKSVLFIFCGSTIEAVKKKCGLYSKFFNELLEVFFLKKIFEKSLPVVESKILCGHMCYFCFQVLLTPCVLLLVKLWRLACVLASGNKEKNKTLFSQVGF